MDTKTILLIGGGIAVVALVLMKGGGGSAPAATQFVNTGPRYTQGPESGSQDYQAASQERIALMQGKLQAFSNLLQYRLAQSEIDARLKAQQLQSGIRNFPKAG